MVFSVGFSCFKDFAVSYNSEIKCKNRFTVQKRRFTTIFYIFDIKRIIGKEFGEIIIDALWPFKVLPNSNQALIEFRTLNGTNVKTAEEITAILLSNIKKTCEIYQGNKIAEVVITIPAKFSEKQKEATKKAAKMAGFQTIHFIPEPVAAAFAYFTEIEIPNQSNVLIFDCGGGTTDICIANISNNRITVFSAIGDSYLGGRDFDRILYNHFDGCLKQKYGIHVEMSDKRYVLKQKCQNIKHNLSVAEGDW